MGFELIRTNGVTMSRGPQDCYNFAGLAKSNDPSCVLDGNGDGCGFWNCIGIIKKHAGGIPGASQSIETKSELYVQPIGGSGANGYPPQYNPGYPPNYNPGYQPPNYNPGYQPR